MFTISLLQKTNNKNAPLLRSILCNLAEPPNFFVYDYADKVNEPDERSEEEHDDRNNDSGSVLNVQALDQTVYGPNNVECGNAKKKFYDEGKFIH